MSGHETDDERKAALAAMFNPVDLNAEPAEPPIEGLPPKDKNVADYSDEEREAQTQLTMRTMREREQRQQREHEQRETDATRTPEQQHGDDMGQLLGGRSALDDAFARVIHRSEDPE